MNKKKKKKKKTCFGYHGHVDINVNDGLTESEVFTGKSLTETLPVRSRFKIFP